MRKLVVILAIELLATLAVAEDWKPFVLKVKSYQDAGGTIRIQLLSGKTIEVTKEDWSSEWSEIVTAAQQNREKEKAARSSAEPPDDSVAAPLIRSKCLTEWKDDFRMRKYCEDQQQEALEALRARQLTGPLAKIRSNCAKEWRDDFRMRDYCEKQQLEALRGLSRP